jgi:hypothetical protein
MIILYNSDYIEHKKDGTSFSDLIVKYDSGYGVKNPYEALEIFFSNFILENNIKNGQCVHIGSNCETINEWNCQCSSFFTKLGFDTYYFDLLKKFRIHSIFDVSSDNLKKHYSNEKINKVVEFEMRVGMCKENEFHPSNRFEDYVPDDEEFKVLQIDVDGQDYWILASIEREYDIIIVEFNRQIRDDMVMNYMHDIEVNGIEYKSNNEITQNRYIAGGFDSFKRLADFKGYYVFANMDNDIMLLNKKYQSRYPEIQVSSEEFFKPYDDKEIYPLIDTTKESYEPVEEVVLNPPVDFSTLKCDESAPLADNEITYYGLYDTDKW